MKLGDRVSVINDHLEGKITSIIGEEIVLQDEHGFTHRFNKNEVVLKDDSFYTQVDVEFKNEKNIQVKSKKHNKKHLVLDLHFEKLVSNPSDYNGIERLFIQKKKLLDTLDFCREHRLKKLEIIHGIGDGTLQKMVNEVLSYQADLDFHNLEILHHQSGNIMVYLK